MTKSIIPTQSANSEYSELISNFENKRKDVEKRLSDLKVQRTTLSADIKENSKMLLTVEQGTDVLIPTGRSSVLDQFRGILEDTKTEEERQQKIDIYKLAVSKAAEQLQEIDSELLQLSSKLKTLDNDIDFYTNYASYHDTFKNGFDGRGFNIGDPELNNPRYRAYLKSRVKINPVLTELVTAYSELENSIDKLIATYDIKTPGGLGFDPRVLLVNFRKIEVDKNTSKVSLKIEENYF